MACNCEPTPCGCTQSEPCVQTDCTCPIKDLSTDCVLYDGDTLTCSSIAGDQTLTEVLEQLDAFICAQFDTITNYLQLVNIGNGARVYKQTNLAGQKELRTIKSADTTLLEVIENDDTIDILAGSHRLEFADNILSLIVATITDGDTLLSTVDLSALDTVDNYVTGASFDGGTNTLTITRNNGLPDITVDLSSLSVPDVYLETATYDSVTNNIVLTLNDTTEITLNVDNIFNDAQVQSDYLEDDINSPAYIQNRNPQKEIVSSYQLQDSDNNYVIFINNDVNNITIDCAAITAVDNYYVGFVQQGTGTVTFLNYNVKPVGQQDVIYGQGHVAAVEIYNGTIHIFGTFKVEV